ncbi:MAG TPA: tetratricopeptide repeat protein [Alphaproteobacteria bacterium]|jgi:tetratricopeptide (TPR) repeat protein|nr:tetratricopeptide repeat protein [Alphaproteobacteria bacterium]
MEISLAQQAISLAIQGNWNEAIKINLEILKSSPHDTDSLNRLAKAYAEIGEIDKAKKTAQKVLKIEPTNHIASKSLDKWQAVKNGIIPTKSSTSTESFLEDPGKTKIVTLINPGDKQIIANLDSGDIVKLLPHPHSVAVVTDNNKYIGKLPDDLAARLKSLIKKGNKYDVIIKSVEKKQVTVFIRSDTFSFPTEKIDYVSFTPPELVHKDVPIMDDIEEGSAEETD